MSRAALFETEEVDGIRGLTALTEPDRNEDVGAIIDLAVIGARGDGKTQFIVHAIRTLRAYAPPLSGMEHEHNRDILRMVMNAREPCPDATRPGVVPHYVFRLAPEDLLAQIGFAGRLGLLARAAGLRLYLLLALINATALVALFVFLRGALDPVGVAVGSGALAVGAGLGWALARRRFLAAGETEIVFWDVAGEHVYSHSAADYYSFLSALVRRRRERAAGLDSRPGGYAYGFAPILLCNPLALGLRRDGSAYARLRRLIPLFATLGGRAARAMVAINRWSVVEGICQRDSERDQVVAVAPRARHPAGDSEGGGVGTEAEVEAAHRSDEPPAALPVVRRDVVRRHCLDAEDCDDMGISFTYLRYDAGIQCELTAREWQGYDALPERVRSRYRAPSVDDTAVFIDYEYEDGPGSFEGDTRATFLRWLATMAYGRRTVKEVRDATLASPREEEDDAAWSASDLRWGPRGAEAERALREMTRAIEGALDEAEAEEAQQSGAAEREADVWDDGGTSPGYGPAAPPEPREPQQSDTHRASSERPPSLVHDTVREVDADSDPGLRRGFSGGN